MTRPAQVGGKATWLLAGALLLLAVLGALAVGRFPIGPAELPAILLGRADGPAAAGSWNIRLPRVVAATLVGALLAAAGAPGSAPPARGG